MSKKPESKKPVSKKERDDGDDFGGMSIAGVGLVLAVAALAHPWKALKALVGLAGGLAYRSGRWVIELVMFPFRLAGLLWSQHMADRRPTFEDYLHRDDEDG
ncbi:hypothetical protein GBF35_00500 [Nonomuraea phyllanthi]|uniref:hypothetical protein n=1 Tax=Nonomuraea phyllanthi TaxID=2219224 RepID=UPI001292FCE0|nr:hypothetical protein [Nonomuraea phyllanthi]QFY05363.1 hypothetical protein GBF35_00500 [Nonomuraea phyllanthi]